MKKLINKISMLLKDPDPCQDCLVIPICKKLCDNKRSWNGRINNYWIALIPMLYVYTIVSTMFIFLIASLFHRFGVINDKQLKALNPLPDDKGRDYDFY